MIAVLSLALLCIVLSVTVALQPGDRVSMLTQTFHSDTKTEWLDMPLHLMPRFTTPGSHIFHVTIPKFAKNATEYRINPRNDLKVSFTFLGNKLSLPNIQVYNAKERVALKKLVITFTHDEFEVVKVDIEKTCKYFLAAFESLSTSSTSLIAADCQFLSTLYFRT